MADDELDRLASPGTATLNFLSGGGEMGALMRAHDWSASSLGPPTRWPQSLRTVVRLLLNTGHPMYIFWGADGACLYNDAYRESIGPERHPGSLGLPVRQVWQEIWDIIGPQVAQVMSGGGATWHVNALVPITRNGRREDVYWTYSYSPIDEETAPGGIGGVLVVCTETTQQVQTARQLEAERDKLALLFEQSPIFMAMLRGPEHRIELVNPGYMQLIGHRQVLGKTVAEALPDAVAQGYLALLDHVYTSGTPYAGTGAKFSVQAEPGGSVVERVVDFVYQPIKERDGAVTGIFVQGADVTERARADAALRVIEPRFRGLLETIPGFIWTADASGEMDYISPRFLAFVGRDEVRFKTRFWPEFVHPDDLAEVTGQWARANAARGSFRADVRLRRHDDVWRWLDIRAEPELNAAGELLGWYGYGADHHEQKETAAALAASESRFRGMATQLSDANRLKDEFLATLSHELRTPLNAVLGYSRMLRQGQLSRDRTARAVEVIERNATALQQIIEDVLDVSRIVSGRLRMNVEEVDLPTILHEALASVLPAAEAKGVRVDSIVDSPASHVSGDPSRLQQVMWNLLSNAIKFTPRGGRVQLRLARVDSHVEITVSDTGQGIAPAFLPFVFDRFRQGDASFTREHGGLGLGLAIARQLAELHGGTLAASSAGVGQGATFTLTLPVMIVRSAGEPALPSVHPTSDRVAPHSDAMPRLDGVRVLAVDDEPDSLNLLREVLESAGATVTTASSGMDALIALQRDRPDILLADLGMPHMDGLQLIRAVRQLDEPLRDVPAAALTAFARSQDRVTSLASGFQLHLAKPIDPLELTVAVASLVARPSAR